MTQSNVSFRPEMLTMQAWLLASLINLTKASAYGKLIIIELRNV